MSERDDQHVHEGRDAEDQPQELQDALRREHRRDLQGDAEENRNLTGSTTWETLADEQEDGQEGRGR